MRRRGGPGARELRRRRGPDGRPGPRRARLGRSRAGLPSRCRRDARDRRAGRGRGRGAGRRGHRPRLRRGLAVLEPGDVVPGHRSGPSARRGVAAPDAVPAGDPGRRARDPGRGAAGGRSRRRRTRLAGTAPPTWWTSRPCTRPCTATSSSSGPPAPLVAHLDDGGAEAALAAYGERARRRRPPSATDGLVHVVPLLRAGDRGRRAREPCAPSTSTACPSTWSRWTTGGAPDSGRGWWTPSSSARWPRWSTRRGRPAGAPASGWPRSSSVPRRRWRASTRTGWSGPPGTTGARTSSGWT